MARLHRRAATDAQRSLRLTLRTNLAKLLTLACLVPPSVVGIAQRAQQFSSAEGGVAADSVATFVAVVSAIGPIGSVIGALLGGRWADAGATPLIARWLVALVSTIVGGLGLTWMVAADERWAFGAAWFIAHLGCSAAMTAQRSLLSHTLPAHRRRGASVMVAFTYVGAGLPLLALLLFPSSVWGVTLVLVALAVLVSASGLIAARTEQHEATAVDETGPHRAAIPIRVLLPWPLLLFAHFSAHLAASAYLSYHTLDIVARYSSGWDDQAVRLSTALLLLTLVGLLGAVGIMIWRPVVLTHALPLLIATGVTLAVAVAARGLLEHLWVLALSMLLAGAALGINSTLIFTAALEGSRRGREGRRLGVYSAITPVGQVIGPPLGAAALMLVPGIDGYTLLYTAIAVFPLAWAVWAALCWRRPSPHPAHTEPSPRTRSDARA